MIDLIAKAKDVCSTNHKTWTKSNEPIRSRSLSSNHTPVTAGKRIVQASHYLPLIGQESGVRLSSQS